MTATASYVICATPRTGSYLLCDALEATGVAGRPTEHFSATYQRHWQRVWSAADHPAYVARVLEEGSTDNGVFGTKLHRHQLDHLLRQLTGSPDVDPRRGRAVLEQVLPQPRWILLTRRDTVAQAVSYTRSMQTEIWWDADTAPAPTAPPRPDAARFDFAQIEAYRLRLRRWGRRWRSWFDGNGLTPLVVAYEDLVQDLTGTLARVLEHLQLSAPPSLPRPVPRLRRQADGTNAEWIRRFTALRAAKAQRTLAAFQDLHRDQPMVVCGCGASLTRLDRTNDRLTIGVNDVGRAFPPSYLVVVDPPRRIDPSRWEHIRSARADVLFTNQFLDVAHPFLVRMALRETAGPTLADGTSVHVLRRPWYSPYVALSLASLLGAEPVGLIGVDFSDDHFFGATGPYPGIRNLPGVDAQFRALRGVLLRTGRRVANLSDRSRVTAFPHLPPADFDRLPPRPVRRDRRPPLQVVVYDADAGVLGGLAARCIWAETGHLARFVHGALDGHPLAWPDLDWTRDRPAVEEELRLADVVLTVGEVLPEHAELVRRRPRLRLRPAADGPALRLGRATVPAPIPLWSERFSPDERDGVLTVLLGAGGSDGEGRAGLLHLLRAAADGSPIRVVDAADAESDLRKWSGRADVVVDPATTGPWTWSLAGLARGAVVVNRLAGSPAALRELRRFAGAGGTPFEHGAGEGLGRVLTRTLRTSRADLAVRGAEGRAWMERRWAFAQHWDRWWLPVLHEAITAHTRGWTDG